MIESRTDMDTTFLSTIGTNILLLAFMCLKQWKQKRDILRAQHARIAHQAVRSVRSTYTRPIVVERLRAVSYTAAQPRSNNPRGDTLNSISTLRLTTEEKKIAKHRAREFMRNEVAASGCCRVSDVVIDNLVEDAYASLPSLFYNTANESTCVVQLATETVKERLDTPCNSSCDFV